MKTGFALALAGSALAATQSKVTVAGQPAVMSTSASSAAINCPKGEYLTYSIKMQDLPSGISLTQAQNYFKNFIGDAPGTVLSTSGNGVGSTRIYNTTDSSLKAKSSFYEKLTSVSYPASNGANLVQGWANQGSEILYSGSLVLYQDISSLTIGQPQGKSPFIQYYKNVCANSQNLAYKALAQKLQDDVNFWINAIQNKPPPVSSSVVSSSVVSSSRSSSVSASSTSSLPPANPTSTSISCKKGQSLTYAIQSQMDPGTTLASAKAYFNNWIGDAPSSSRQGSSGNNAVGSTRAWTVTDSSLQSVAPISEVLTQVLTNSGSNLELKWQIQKSQGYYNGQLVLYQSFHDLTVGEDNNGNVFLQYFINTCASNQSLANKALPTIILDALNFWNAAA